MKFNEIGEFSELSRLGKAEDENCDLPANEFWLGGEIVRDMETDDIL